MRLAVYCVKAQSSAALRLIKSSDQVNIIRQARLEEFESIERLLYGNNYEVCFHLYGPSDSGIGLAEALKTLISTECELFGVAPSSPEAAANQIVEMVLYEGDAGSGPLELESKKVEVLALISNVLSRIGLGSADLVVEFSLKHGHPAYPVFWDFAYDIHSNGQRWVFIGSSSD